MGDTLEEDKPEEDAVTPDIPQVTPPLDTTPVAKGYTPSAGYDAAAVARADQAFNARLSSDRKAASDDPWANAFTGHHPEDPWAKAFSLERTLNGQTLDQSLAADRARLSFQKIGSAFIQGWDGAAIIPPGKLSLGPESEKQLKALTTYTDIDKAHQTTWQAFNDAFLAPAVQTLAQIATVNLNALIQPAQLSVQLGGGLFGAAGSTIEQEVSRIGGPLAGREAAALVTEFLPMHTTGIPEAREAPRAEPLRAPETLPRVPTVQEAPPATPITPDIIEEARRQGVIGTQSEWDGTSVYAAARPEEIAAGSMDVHGIARQIDPGTFEEYDRLRSVHDLALQEFRDETNRARAEVEASPAAHGEQLADIGAELDNLQNVPNDRYVNRRRNQLLRQQEQLRGEREAYLANAPDLAEMVLRSPENLQLRNFIASNAQDLLALEPRVRDVYAEAARRAGQVEAVRPEEAAPAAAPTAPAAEPAAPAQPTPEDFLAERRHLEGPVQLTIGETTTTQHGITGDLELHRALSIAGGEVAGVSPSAWGRGVAYARSIGRDDVADAIQRRWEGERTKSYISDELRADGDRLIGRPQQQPAPETQPPLNIANHAAEQFRAAGRPVQEASDLGALVDAYYQTKAARFEGAKGSAADLYRAEAPSIVGRASGPRDASGLLQRAGGRTVLTLFAKADPSTALHELGHFWTIDTLRDAADPAATAQLSGDAAAIRSWLGVSEDGELTTRQQERMARGFETYMREGVAPSTRLAQVFSRFKDWMTRIYQTLRDRSVPINDDIRGVFDRWFAQTGEDRPAIVAPEQEAPPRKPRGLGEIMRDERVRENVARQMQSQELIAYADWQAANRNAGTLATPAAAPPATIPGERPRTPRSLAQIMAEDRVGPARAAAVQGEEMIALSDWQAAQRTKAAAAAPVVTEGSFTSEQTQELARKMLQPEETPRPEAPPPTQAAEVAPEPVVARNFGPEAKPPPPLPDRTRPYMQVPKEPKRLLEFMKEGVINENGVRLFGRVKDPGGDLAASLGDRSLIRRYIDNQNGEPLDEFARRAADEGYFNGIEPDTTSGVIDRIVADAEGHAQYSMHDQDSVSAYEQATAHNREITRLASEHDIDPRGMTRQAFFKAIEDRVGREQFDAQAAMERARAFDAANELRDDLQDWPGNEDEHAGALDDLERERLWREATASQELDHGVAGGEQPGISDRNAGTGQDGAGHGGGGAGDAGPAIEPGAAAGARTEPGPGPATEPGTKPAAGSPATAPAASLSEDLKRRTADLPKIGNIRLEYIDDGRYDDLLRDVAGEISLSGDPRVREGAERITAINAIMNEAAQQHLDAIAKYQEAPTPDNLIALEQARLRNAVAFENRSIAATDWAYTGHAQQRLIENSKRIIEQVKEAGGEDEFKLFQRQYEAGLQTQMQTVDQLGKSARDGLLGKVYAARQGLMATFINGLLSNPVTHGGYLIGTQLWEAARGLFIPFEAAAGVLSRTAGEHVLFGEMAQHYIGMAEGWKRGVVPAWRAFKTGEVLMEGLGPKAVPMDQVILPTLLGGRVGYVLETPSRTIRAIHVFNYSTAYSAEMYRAAYREAARQLGEQPATVFDYGGAMQRFLNDPPPEAVDYAHDQAIRATLMRRPAPGSLQANVSSFLSKQPETRLIAPFPQIGMNLTEEGLTRVTPLGLASASVRADIKAGGARADRAIGSMAAGTTMAGIAVALALDGTLTGPGPDPGTEDGRNKLRVLTEQGWAPYAVRIGNSYFPYLKLLGPMGHLFGTAATLADAGRAMANDQYQEGFSRLGQGFKEVVLDETWFRNVHDFLDAVMDREKGVSSFLKNLAASAVPFSGLQRGLTTTLFDPYKRQADTVGEKIAAQTPFLSQTLNPQIGPNGQPILSHSTMGPHILQNDPVDQRRIELGMGVAAWPREIKGVPLTEDQRERFGRLAGTLSHQWLLPIVTAPGFANMPRGYQMMQIEAYQKAARQQAEATVQAEQAVAASQTGQPTMIQQQMDTKRNMLIEGRKPAGTPYMH